MRLLHTKTLQTKEFYSDKPPYAILSHTWEKEEVTYQDMLNLETAKTKNGYRKVQKACEYARKYDFEWVWIDSCCINKESSAELSEAINSMYQYYEGSHVCIAYLSDVSSREDPRDLRSCFRDSKWFKRGWTLQELLAPSYVVLLDEDWTEVGTRWSLRDVISVITSIPVRVFEGDDIHDFSIAQRMSWAAFRETTRPEDMAYCLMGIFGVNMPPIYGEGGDKAFMRLQQEIIRISDDRSIFAWVASVGDDESRGLFARSAFEFRVSGDVVISRFGMASDKSSYSFANNGLHIHLPLVPALPNSSDLFLASLDCQSERDGQHLAVYLKRTTGQRYVRVRANELVLTPSPSLDHIQELVVKENRSLRMPKEAHFRTQVDIRLSPLARRCLNFSKASPSALFTKASSSAFFIIGRSSFDEKRGRVYLRSDTLWLEYEVTSTEEPFVVHLRSRPSVQSIPYFKVVGEKNIPMSMHELGSQPKSQTNELRDRVLMPLKRGGLLSLAMRMTGAVDAFSPFEPILTSILEIDYILEDTSSMTMELRLPVLGFTVPTRINDLGSSGSHLMPRSLSLSLRAVYPPDFSQRSCDNSTFLPISDPCVKTSIMFRILAYDLITSGSAYSSSRSKTAYVALGLHRNQSAVWVDMKLHDTPKSSLAELEADWKHYLDSGLQHGTSVSIAIAGFRTLTAVAEKRSTLQLGTHCLRFELEKPPDK
ncbi:hypothetical protein VKT23_008077 [Stygiomarasmius scandens]|uniref:Heterokaryon incompatibility domain-containing protein n=1 Tax=Marasmiellus scandens TaxID=2682957 RepID=A0ABR1JLE9_9AGAR